MHQTNTWLYKHHKMTQAFKDPVYGRTPEEMPAVNIPKVK